MCEAGWKTEWTVRVWGRFGSTLACENGNVAVG
jgi:hypothetical protein